MGIVKCIGILTSGASTTDFKLKVYIEDTRVW